MDPVERHFSTIDDYNTVADLVVRKNDEMHQALANAIESVLQQQFSLLDLGCGTGHGLSRILNYHPRAFVVGADFSRKMVLKAAEHLSDYDPLVIMRGEKYSDAEYSAIEDLIAQRERRVILVEHNFNTFRMLGTYDAIVSAFAIHNSSHQIQKKIIGAAHSALHHGGVFANADFIRGETPEEDRRWHDAYLDYVRSHLSGAELDAWERHINEDDKPMKLSEHESRLREVGFHTIEKPFSFENEAVYVARKD